MQYTLVFSVREKLLERMHEDFHPAMADLAQVIPLTLLSSSFETLLFT